jgi:hypothetical protein
VPVLVYGAGTSGVAAARELFHNAAAGLRPIGFVDDDVQKRGKLVIGLPVFGTERELEGIIRARAAEAVIIATEKIPEDRIARAVDACRRAGVSVFRMNVQVERLVEGAVSGAPGRFISPIPAVTSAPAARAAVVETLHLVSAETCPSCAGRNMSRSQARTLYERLRKGHTPKRLYRCQPCGWRGWLAPLEFGCLAPGDGAEVLDLSRIDSALDAPPLLGVAGNR